jgi:hypothetical protein
MTFAYAGPENVILRVSAAEHRPLTPAEARELADQLVEAAAKVEPPPAPSTYPLSGPAAIRLVTGGQPVPVPRIR